VSAASPRDDNFMTDIERAATESPNRGARSGMARRLRWKGLALPAALLAGWYGGSAIGLFPPQIMPSPDAVARDLWKLWANGQLLGHIWITVWRVASGFVFGTLAATALGAATGYWRQARKFLDPTIQALKAVPSLAWVPLFILWFGIFEASKITLIAVGVFFPVYLNLMTGIQGVDRKLVEVGRVNNLSAFDLVRRILVPATLPSYFTGLRAGLALGWMFVIAAELMGASRGLGFLMIDGEMTGRPSIIVGALILFAIAGKFTDAMIVALGRHVLSWQDDLASLQEREAG
jgi:sulfonate transport system permease protein